MPEEEPGSARFFESLQIRGVSMACQAWHVTAWPALGMARSEVGCRACCRTRALTAEAHTFWEIFDERNLVAVTFTDPADPLREVDILVAPPLDARALVERSIMLDLDGTTVRVACFDDLIALKRAGGRPQDLADLVLLERIREDGNV